MAIPVEMLEQLGIHVTSEQVEALVAEALRDVVAGRRGIAAAEELTPAEAAALTAGGLRLDPVDWAADDPLVRTAADYAALVTASLTVAESAARLGVDPSRVRHRLAAGTLYGIRTADGWRLPAFQFDGDHLVPGLARVLPRLAPDLHPVAVWRWLTTPTTDLTTDPDAAPLSPLAWLRAGFDSGPVARLAADL